MPVTGNIASYRMAICSRWGEQLFATDDPSVGWDGTRNGQLLPEGSYMYSISYEYRDPDTGNLQSEEKTGHLHLLR